MTQEIRDLLARTGRLFTQEPNDVGHIPDFWRKKIGELCDALEAAPLDVADSLRAEQEAHAATWTDLEHAQGARASLAQRLASKEVDVARATERASAAVRLVEEAVPRMQTLNNAMSPDWLRRAAEFLEG